MLLVSRDFLALPGDIDHRQNGGCTQKRFIYFSSPFSVAGFLPSSV
jgi:hypothetical protein